MVSNEIVIGTLSGLTTGFAIYIVTKTLDEFEIYIFEYLSIKNKIAKALIRAGTQVLFFLLVIGIAYKILLTL